MRRTVPLLRGAKGFGWYGKFKREGSEGFRKFTPPTPFDWSTSPSISANNSSGPTDSPARPKAVLEISYGGKPMGALKVELAQDVVPKTVSNFLTLCNETSQRTYKGSKLHQIRKGSYIMGGDVENLDGTGNHSAHPEQRFLPEENFIIPHTSRGLVR